jgi:hypothetical protein
MTGIIENISYRTAEVYQSIIMLVLYSSSYSLQNKYLRTHVDVDIFSYCGLWNWCQKFVHTSELHPVFDLIQPMTCIFTFTDESKVEQYPVTDYKYFPVASSVILHITQALTFVS